MIAGQGGRAIFILLLAKRAISSLNFVRQ